MTEDKVPREKTIRQRVIVEVDGESLKIVETLPTELTLQKAYTKLGQLIRADKKIGATRKLELILR